MASRGTPPRLELARELPRARLVLVQHQEADVPAALAQVGQQQSRCASEPEMPATFCEWRTTSPLAPPRGPRGPALDRVARVDPLAQSRPSALRSAVASARESGRRAPSASSRGKRSSAVEQLVEDGFEASTGRHVAAAS